jgi:5-methylcytosine-specific restriction enzyme subunit McrC
MDTKWKLVDEHRATNEHKYDLSQADFYQLAAYGEKYLSGEGDMLLIYPRHADFTAPLPVFEFNSALRLWVVPFDLDERKLVAGPWSEKIPVLGVYNQMVPFDGEAA